MRIVCPSCDAAYEVPDAAIASRRLMRCARCAHEFSPDAQPGPAVANTVAAHEGVETAQLQADPPIAAHESEAPVSDDPDLPDPDFNDPDLTDPDAGDPDPAAPPPAEAMAATARPAPWRDRRAQVLAAWAASLLLLFGLANACLAERAPIMHAWPASARLYGWLGPNPR